MPRIKKPVEEVVNSITVNGFDIRLNSIYILESRYDASSPAIHDEDKVRKNPSSKIAECKGVPFVGDGVSGMYDTGLYVNSPSWRGVDKTIVEKKVEFLNKHVKEPLEVFYNKEAYLHHQSDDFWNTFEMCLYDGYVFNTEKPEELLKLFLAVYHKMIIPSDIESDKRKSATWRTADFVVVDSKGSSTRKEMLELEKQKAIVKIVQLGEDNKDELVLILKYAGLEGLSNDISVVSILSQFTRWVDTDGKTKIDTFNNVLDGSNSQAGKEKLQIYDKLLQLRKTKQITKEGRDFVYKGINLTSSFRAAADRIAKDPDLQELKDEILLSDE